MKRRLIAVVAGLLVFGLIHAQSDFSGVWNASLNIAGNIRLILHIKASQNNTYSGTFDSPDQKAFAIKCDTVLITQGAKGETLRFTIIKYKVSYTGTLTNDSTLSGTFTQGANIPLDFHRNGMSYIAKQLIRPQTPKPPFPYNIQQVVYSGNGLQYGGTITIPQGKGPFPALVLITGSGQQDRDETLFDHKPFAVIADALTRDGFIVLRVDDRGIGSSTGNFAASTTADFIKDVNVSVDYLKTRPEVNDKKIGLLGHSEGGMIAPVIASQRKDINFIVLMAAPAVKLIDLMAEQNAAVMKSAGIDPAFAESFRPVYTQIITAINNTSDTAIAAKNALAILKQWQSTADTTGLRQLGFNGESNAEDYINETVATASSPWFRYFINFDPQPYLSKLKKIKVLALNGSKDIQVVAQQNLPALKNALQQGHTKTYEIKELPGLNHLFQTCTKCTVFEYGQLEETMSPVALQTITTWLNNNVK